MKFDHGNLQLSHSTTPSPNHWKGSEVKPRRTLALIKSGITLIFFRILATPLRLVPQKRKGQVVELFMQAIAEEYAAQKQGFIRYNVTPFAANHAKFSNANYPNTAIVMSGKIHTKFNFTLNTLRLIRNLHPEITIIYSGWEELKSISEELSNLKIEIVISNPPSIDSPFNARHQAISMSAGLQRALDLGLAYSIRMRADQRFQNPSTLEYLHSLHHVFKLSDKSVNLQGRIIGISDCLSQFAIGHFPDHFHFGYTEDLLKYWQDPIQTNFNPEIDLSNMANFLDYNQYTEQVLGNNFLSNISSPALRSIEDYLSHLAKYWIIIERQDIDLFWAKYRWWDQDRGDQFDRHLKFPFHKRFHTTSNIHREQWLSLMLGTFHPRDVNLEELRMMSTSEVLFES
jgi:hypothetical protein